MRREQLGTSTKGTVIVGAWYTHRVNITLIDGYFDRNALEHCLQAYPEFKGVYLSTPGGVIRKWRHPHSSRIQGNRTILAF